MTQRVYFDWNATAPFRAEARAAVLAALESAGNASSVHAEGRAARAVVEKARGEVAALAGAAPGDVIFTSGATEANMLALQPFSDCDRLFVSAVEHPSVKSGGRFASGDIEELPVDADGTLDLHALRNAIARSARPLVSVMLANNETGVIQPIHQIAGTVHAAGGYMHVDAVQAPGRIACRIDDLGADLMTISSHKLGGPQGAGALVRRGGIPLEPLIKGGGQERGQRAGTENVAAIAGFGAACAAASLADAPRITALRDRLETGILAATPDAIIFGCKAARLPNTTLFTVPGLKAETAIIAFDLDGIAVSSGAACSSGKVQPSAVLKAMGVGPEVARGAVRASLGWSTTEHEIDRFLGTWRKLAESLLKERRELAA